MSVSPPQCRLASSVGAYVLGALPLPEAREYASHLDQCQLCREDVARLCGVVDLLPVAVAPATPPPSLRRTVLATAQREAVERRRSTRPSARSGPLVSLRMTLAATGAAAFAAAVVVAAVVGLGSGRGPDHLQPRLVGRVTVLSPGGSGELVVSGNQASLRVRGLPEAPHGRVYEVWLQREGRAPQATEALFTTNEQGRAEVAVPGSLAGVRRVLVTSEPRRGSVVPTRQPVIVATF